MFQLTKRYSIFQEPGRKRRRRNERSRGPARAEHEALTGRGVALRSSSAAPPRPRVHSQPTSRARAHRALAPTPHGQEGSEREGGSENFTPHVYTPAVWLQGVVWTNAKAESFLFHGSSIGALPSRDSGGDPERTVWETESSWESLASEHKAGTGPDFTCESSARPSTGGKRDVSTWLEDLPVVDVLQEPPVFRRTRWADAVRDGRFRLRSTPRPGQADSRARRCPRTPLITRSAPETRQAKQSQSCTRQIGTVCFLAPLRRPQKALPRTAPSRSPWAKRGKAGIWAPERAARGTATPTVCFGLTRYTQLGAAPKTGVRGSETGRALRGRGPDRPVQRRGERRPQCPPTPALVCYSEKPAIFPSALPHIWTPFQVEERDGRQREGGGKPGEIEVDGESKPQQGSTRRIDWPSSRMQKTKKKKNRTMLSRSWSRN
ncbi:hypothetical protein GN956_G19318 [Arapaima gigas]